MPKMISAIAAGALATCAVMLSPAAHAAEAKVSWADLDLSSDAGQAELSHRIEGAARKACVAQATTGTRIARYTTSQCRRDVTRKIAERVSEMNEGTRFGG